MKIFCDPLYQKADRTINSFAFLVKPNYHANFDLFYKLSLDERFQQD